MPDIRYLLIVISAFQNSSIQKPKLAKPYSGLLNTPIHQFEWPIKGRTVLESLLKIKMNGI